jgi:hypothetical protein
MPTREVTREELLAGYLAEAIDALCTADRPPAVEPTGIEEAADVLEPLLEHRSRRAGHASRLGSADSTGTSSATSVVNGS